MFLDEAIFRSLKARGPGAMPLSAAQFEEAFPTAGFGSWTDLRLVLFSWCDHALEPYDPRLVKVTIEAACAAAGKTPPGAPTRWLWRLVGVVLGGLGALGLMFCLPAFSPRFAGMRGPLIALIALASVILTTSTWVGAAPVLRRVPLQLALMALVWLVLFVAGKLSLPRWSFVALAAASAFGGAVEGAYYFALVTFICGLVLFAGTVAGWIAARHGTRRDGEIAMAIFMGYAVGLWIPGILLL